MHPYRENARIEAPDPRAHQRLTIGLVAACAFIAGIGSATAVSTFTRMRELDAFEAQPQRILVVPLQGDSVIVPTSSFENAVSQFDHVGAARSLAEAQARSQKYCRIGRVQGRATVTFEPVTGRVSNVDLAGVEPSQISNGRQECLKRVLHGARVHPFQQGVHSAEQRLTVLLANRESVTCAPGDPLCANF